MGRVKEVSRGDRFLPLPQGLLQKDYLAYRKRRYALRVTHNDTKLNNVLIDLGRDEFAAVIDLDTVMPGSIVYDFGDGIRSGANTGAEDERDLSLVNFNMEMYKAYTRGFMGGGSPRAGPIRNREYGFRALLMTFECGMRFLTDHIEGDKYFRIHREGHNLDRARTQIKMVTEMENKINDMNEIVRYYAVENQNSRDTPRLRTCSRMSPAAIASSTPRYRITTTGENLVFVFDCVEDSPVVFGDKDNDKLYKGDVVEVMITLGRPERYLEEA